MYPIILASGSPRRKEILSQVGLPFTVEPSSKEEATTATLPSEFVMSLSEIKAEDIACKQTKPCMVIGADTIVALGDKILGKPKDVEEAYIMLKSLSNKSHEVYTGVTVIVIDESNRINKTTFYEMAKVFIAPLSDEEIYAYIQSKEPMDKAGAYAIQGRFACYVERIEGDYYTVVGLPIAHLYKVIKEMNK